MRERERHHDEVERPQPTAGGENLGTIAGTATQLLAASDAIIDRALSGDSDAFLRANRQQGGQ